MDEPFGALDAETRRSMQELLNEVITKTEMTVVLVTHDIIEALFPIESSSCRVIPVACA